jgi:hypothetical protein
MPTYCHAANTILVPPNSQNTIPYFGFFITSGPFLKLDRAGSAKSLYGERLAVTWTPDSTRHEKAAAGLRISDGFNAILHGDVSPQLIKPYRPAVKEGLVDPTTA